MKNIVVLYCCCCDESESSRIFDKNFGEKSAFDLVLDWAGKNGEKIVLLSDSLSAKKISDEASFKEKKCELVQKDSWSNSDVAHAVSESCSKNSADFALLSFADMPFLNDYLTKELINIHTKYSAEYSFADGYPLGLTPEVIDKGCASIIAALCDDVQKEIGSLPFSRDGIFSIMKTDINSFEIETMLSDEDYRMLRLEFSCADKINFEACKNAFRIKKDGEKIGLAFAKSDTDDLFADSSLIKTVPSFYNVQISGKSSHASVYNPRIPVAPDMKLEDFRSLVEKISAFSEKAVVSLSCFGEPLLHPDFAAFVDAVVSHKKLSLLIETDGTLVTQGLADSISEILAKNGRGTDCINWIICLDAMEKSLYAKLHSCPETDFEKAVASVGILNQKFSGHVYPQMIRMKANECELEAFYRFWKEKTSPSGGQLIIQKYNNFCGKLSDEKSADLSPLERNPCWHIRRDMVVLSDGSVPLCRQCYDAPLGNCMEEGLDAIWKKFDEVLENHMNKIYSDTCRTCDEFYTFNF